MASTYSQNLALELMATGDQPGEWGNTTNRNIGTLLEQAISGYAVQVISDIGDTTITIPNGQSGMARNMYIELTGTLTGNRNLVVPNNNKLYFIYNNTTGGYAVTVKTATGVGTAVPAANKVILLCNGSDVVPAINAGGGGGGGTSTFVEEVFTATADQTVFNLSRSYVVGSNTLAVYVDGVNQIVDMSYTETDSDTITFSQGLHEGALVKCVIGQAISTSLISLSQAFVATQDQTVFTLTSFTYQPNTNNLSVFVNGSKQILGVSYSETSTSSITFNTGLNAGDRVELISGEPINLGSVSSENVTYLPAGTGAELTTVQAKLRETVSVKDFGAVGDGITDDTAAIQAAIAASYDRKLFFPQGVYRLTGQYGGLLAGEIVAGGDIIWEGETPDTTLFFDPSASTEGMFGFDLSANTVQVKSLTFDLNNKGSVAMLFQNQSASMAIANLAQAWFDNITVKNARMYTTTIGAFAVYCRGGFSEVNVTNSTFTDLTLDSGLTPGHVGGTHLSIDADPADPADRYCQKTSIERCYFSNVTCDDPAVSVDMDGIRVFAPLPSAFGGTDLVPSTLVVQDSVFENCWTRSIKSRVQLNSVENCTFKRTTSPTAGSNIHVDFQANGGVVQGCKVYNNGVITSTCFNATVNASVEDSLMGFICTGNQIYHTGAGGITYPFATFSNSAGVATAVIKNNTIVADVDALLNFSWLGTTANFVCNDNTVNALSVAVARVTGNGGTVRANMSSNIHLDTANPVPVAVDAVSGASANAIVNGFGNVGIIDILGSYTGGGNRQQMLRGALLGPATWSDAQGNTVGAVGIETVGLADDAAYAFTKRGAQDVALYSLVCENFNINCVAIFSASTAGTVSIHTGTAVDLGSTSNPDTDTKLNIWVDPATNRINIKNRLGSSRNFTLHHIG